MHLAKKREDEGGEEEDIFLIQWFMTTLSKGCKLNNFEPHGSLKFSFTNIRGLCSNFVECESSLESNSPDSLAVWDKLGCLNWFWQFPCEGLPSFDSEGFVTHIDDVGVYVKEGLPFDWNYL